MHVFILAGGFATRLWPLTEKRAKPLLPLAGKPIITHLVEKIPASMPVTVSTNAALQDGFKKWIEDLGRPDVELIVEGTKSDDHKLGALGSIAEWVHAERIHDDLLVLTGDNYLGFSLERFLDAFDGNPLLAAHDIGDLQRAKAFGTVILDRASGSPLDERGGLPREAPRSGAEWGEGRKQRVAGFEEKPHEPKSTLVSTGCVILPESTLTIVKEFSLVKPDNLGGIFEEFLRRGLPVECFTFSERWMDIGSFHSYLDAHKTLVGEHILKDPTATIAESHCAGSVTVGKECSIKRSDVTDCMIFENVRISDCTLQNCVIDDGCVLEGIDLRGKMLRAGTTLIVK